MIRLRRIAQVEYAEAVEWYEARRRGLGLRFFAAVQGVFDQIEEQPDRWPEVSPDVREAPVHGWPYVIYYHIHPDYVMVIAVFHLSRDPAVWQARI